MGSSSNSIVPQVQPAFTTHVRLGISGWQNLGPDEKPRPFVPTGGIGRVHVRAKNSCRKERLRSYIVVIVEAAVPLTFLCSSEPHRQLLRARLAPRKAGWHLD